MVASIVAGTIILLAGLAAYLFQVAHTTDCTSRSSRVPEYVAVGVMIFGAACLPGIFRVVIQPIIIQLFPNGLPLVGGRRRDDPPKE